MAALLSRRKCIQRVKRKSAQWQPSETRSAGHMSFSLTIWVLCTPRHGLRQEFGFEFELELELGSGSGNELTFHANSLTNSVFGTNWLEYSVGTRKLLICYMEFLKRPVKVRAGVFFEIGLPIFVKVKLARGVYISKGIFMLLHFYII